MNQLQANHLAAINGGTQDWDTVKQIFNTRQLDEHRSDDG